MYTFRKYKKEFDARHDITMTLKEAELHAKVRSGDLQGTEEVLEEIAVLSADHKETHRHINMGDEEGRRPLTHALEAGNLPLARLLLRSGCSAAGGAGEPHPLVLALENPKLTELLRGHGADPQSQEVIVEASHRGLVDTVHQLLSDGASARSRDAAGRSCAERAWRNGHSALGNFLQRRQRTEEVLDFLRSQRFRGGDSLRLSNTLLKGVCGFAVPLLEEEERAA